MEGDPIKRSFRVRESLVFADMRVVYQIFHRLTLLSFPPLEPSPIVQTLPIFIQRYSYRPGNPRIVQFSTGDVFVDDRKSHLWFREPSGNLWVAQQYPSSELEYTSYTVADESRRSWFNSKFKPILDATLLKPEYHPSPFSTAVVSQTPWFPAVFRSSPSIGNFCETCFFLEDGTIQVNDSNGRLAVIMVPITRQLGFVSPQGELLCYRVDDFMRLGVPGWLWPKLKSLIYWMDYLDPLLSIP